MVSILLLEDSQNKAQKIVSLLTDTLGINKNNIMTVSDIVNAKRELKEKMFDLLLLDIQIPNRFDQTPKRDGGLTFLKELFYSTRYHLPLQIIGITAYDDIYKDVVPEFSDQLIAIVKYDETSDEWAGKIKHRVEYLLRAKKSYKFYKQKSYENDLAVICAMDQIELESVKNASSEFNEIEIQNDSNNYYQGKFTAPDKEITFIASATPQMGMTSSAVLAMKIINLFYPKYLAMVGITAGMKDKTNIGDILVADPSWDYGSGKYIISNGTSKFLPDPRQIPLHPDIRSKFQTIKSNQPILDNIRNKWPGNKPDESLRLHIGPVASGSAVLADLGVAKLIEEQNRKLIGVELETYSVMYSAMHCPKPRPIAFSIKSVADFADSNKNDQFQSYSAYTSASLLKIIALEYLDYN